ncbi:MAG: hypothetical protein JWP11_2823 [Frankiales bacterium]|nr:hypothetical protein [Frankiales bacterium]
MTATAPAGTCHQVGCPGWGQHPRHGIGTPDTFEPYAQVSNGPGQTLVLTSLLVRVDSLLSALVRGRVAPTSQIPAADLEEARILSEALRSATSGARR